jgi:hypothetical protein
VPDERLDDELLIDERFVEVVPPEERTVPLLDEEPTLDEVPVERLDELPLLRNELDELLDEPP